MPVPTIPNGKEHLFPILYEGNGTGQRVGNFVPFTDDGTIANSCVIDDGSTQYLSRALGTATNTNKFSISVWIKKAGGSNNTIIEAGTNTDNRTILLFTNSTNTLRFLQKSGGSTTIDLQTSRTFEDSTKFYHIMLVYDTTEAEADRVKFYVDGELQTINTSGADYAGTGATDINSTDTHYIGVAGAVGTTTAPFDGYMAEFNFVDGSALTPATFGVTDTSTGRWVPKTLSGITYGTNGFRLQFSTSSAMGDDTANSNDFSLNNIDATNQTTDSPTQNHMTFGGRTGSSITLSEGNLKVSVGAADTKCLTGMGIPTSGKYYWEVTLTTLSTYGRIGVAPADANLGFSPTTDGIAYDRPETAGGMKVLGTDIGSGWDGAFTQGNIMNFALDADNKFLYIGENNVWRNSGDPTSGATGTGGVPYGGTSLQDKILYPSVGSGNAGGTKVYDFNFGQKSLSYTPPTGYVTLQQDNLPATSKGVSGLVWTKNRDRTKSPTIYDSSRGRHLALFPSGNDAETTYVNGVQKFLAGGQAIGENLHENQSGDSFVSWNWVANGGTTASNGDGSITSTVQVNSTAGFSIIRFTGTNSAATVGHGLSVAPDWVISKNLDDTANWAVYHKDLTSYAKTLFLSTNGAETSSTTMWDSKATTADVINVSSNFATNGSSDRMVMYAWHSVDGFSKFGSYEGNTSTFPFVYLGFRPAFMLIKNIDRAVDWIMIDSERDTINSGVSRILKPTTASESQASNQGIDLLSNGFKIRQSSSNAFNANNETHIYMAFAEHPFVGDGTSPVTAR